MQQPWFWPVVIIVVGLPTLLLILTEVHSALVRRGSRAAGIVALLRNFVVPVGAFLLLISQASYLNVDWNWTRIVATVFGFLVILLLVNSMNLVLFEKAQKGTWRDRVPSIFVQIVRLVIIIVCVGGLFAFVWGADIGGLFTALGVGSIVIGLALQNAVGSVVSGLLLLFEQPFELGDWLDADGVRGRVIEVNWRSVHIQTDDGTRIVPNANLASSSFVNLSRSTEAFSVGMSLKFATDDPPMEVIAVCQRVARGLSQTVSDEDAIVTPMRKGNFNVILSLNSPSDEFSGPRTFKTRIWYAARRAGLHYDSDLTDSFQTDENYQAALLKVARPLYLSNEEVTGYRNDVRLERYGAGEVVQALGSTPEAMRFILSGTATLSAPSADGSDIVIAELGSSEFIGLGSLTRQATGASVTAATDLAVLVVPNRVLDKFVRANPRLAVDIGTEIDNRAVKARSRFAEFGLTPLADSRLIA
ncbi:MAG: mechanosensitive ion channel domain-containing protein [Terrimesophilobacter sp.]